MQATFTEYRTMPLPTTDFFNRVLREPYDALCSTPQAIAHLNGTFRYDGVQLEEGDVFELFGVVISSREAAQLLMVFDGARVHEQDQYDYGDDDAPPGTYFTTIHPELVHEGHKNRVGIYDEEGTGEALFLDDVLAGDDDAFPAQEIGPPRAVHVDHFYLRHQAPEGLGTVAFALCAMTAHRMGYTRISLIAGGGRGHDPRMIGYFVWPKLGFDALLDHGETDGQPDLAACITVQDVIAIDETWWRENGSQRLMEFDLGADSRCWEKLLDYLQQKELI
ncbi:hypothetical protein [Paraburkholderia bannensis]|uniref:hypothetical protein n=1 Tax=Paraburkholderia bannensis TaxID=765414 RepID=UPI001FE00C83|nr:hypothetical protein [Paraburkholderia bannensis]